MEKLPIPTAVSRLKTRQVRLIIDLYEHRSVLRAAEAGNMTQPGASKMLRELEEHFGVTLFERRARGVVPTWFGEILVRRARLALAELAKACDEINAFKCGLMGDVAVGAVVDPGITLIPAAIAKLKQQHPNVVVNVDIEPSATLMRRLSARQLDIVVARPIDVSSALTFDALGHESHAIIARADHPIGRKRKVTLKDLMDQPWILPPANSLLRQQIDLMFIKRRLQPPSNFIQTASLPVILALLQSSDAVTALQKRTVQLHLEAGLLKVLIQRIDVEMAPFGIVTLRDRLLSPAAEAMLKFIQVAANSIYRSIEA